MLDITSYMLGKKNGGGGNDYNVKVDTSKTYSDYSGIQSLITEIDNINTKNMTNFSSMFKYCISLTAIPQIDTSSGTSFNSTFYNCTNLTAIPQIDTSSGTSFNSTFYNCTNLTTIPQIDTSNGTDFSNMFQMLSSSALEIIPELDFSKANRINNTFIGANGLNKVPYLTTLGGFKNLGQAYETTQSANYSKYTLTLTYCTNLSHESLMNVINNLYDIATKGCNAQQLTIGATNMAKLTAEEIAVATNKGWTVS